jgi:hypothetical protein
MSKSQITISKVEVACNEQNVTVYLGEPAVGHHPLFFQAKAISELTGNQVDPNVMNVLSKIQELAVANRVSFYSLCAHALDNITQKRPEHEPIPEKYLSNDNQ